MGNFTFGKVTCRVTRCIFSLAFFGREPVSLRRVFFLYGKSVPWEIVSARTVSTRNQGKGGLASSANCFYEKFSFIGKIGFFFSMGRLFPQECVVYGNIFSMGLWFLWEELFLWNIFSTG